MASSGRRDGIDAKIRDWERELERMRVGLAAGPEDRHASQEQRFVALYRRKEVVKSRWETVRGVYRPDAAAVARFEEALKEMEEAWTEYAPLLAGALPNSK